MVFAIAGLGYWLHRSWKLALFVVVSIPDHRQPRLLGSDQWGDSLVGFAETLASVLPGVPLGPLGPPAPWLYSFMRPLLDLMQTLPTSGYLIPTLVLFHLGSGPR